MRYGVLADIHANLHALRAALEALQRHGVDAYVVAGDLVGYGPYPNECVELIAELDAVCVAGNHDLIALGRLSTERCIRLAKESLDWTASVLKDDARTFLEGLPLRTTAPGGVAIAHGSLDDPQEYTVGRAQARAQLAVVGAEGQRVLILGHTHLPWAFAGSVAARSTRGSYRLHSQEPTLLNPGAVGQSRELRARARYLVLDLEAGEARFGAVRYDTRGCRRALLRAGLSPRSCHLRPSLPRAAARAVRRRVR